MKGSRKFNAEAKSFGSRFNALNEILNDGDKAMIVINDQMIGTDSVTNNDKQVKSKQATPFMNINHETIVADRSGAIDQIDNVPIMENNQEVVDKNFPKQVK